MADVWSRLWLLLWDDLEQADLLLDQFKYANYLSSIWETGLIRRQMIQRIVNPTLWQQANALLDTPCTDGDLVRVLGFGEHLTRFLITPVAANKFPEAVVEAGVLANLIVTLYDHYVDQQDDQRDFLPLDLVKGRYLVVQQTEFAG